MTNNNNNHPITPSPELVKDWLGSYFGCTISGGLSPYEEFLATQAARWGANQELKACFDYLIRCASWEQEDVEELRDFRRPKPKSLPEEALALIQAVETSDDLAASWDFSVIRRALKRLQELEGQ